MKVPRIPLSGWVKYALSCAAVGVTAAVVVLFALTGERHHARRSGPPTMQSDLGGTFNSLFTRNYPANRRFQDELSLLRTQGRLKPENEILINRTILSSSSYVNMPPAVLWCLLFQESRLNHLEGLHGDSGARGLGQFSYFSFYEVNHHLERYNTDNLGMMLTLLGKDIRPVEPRVSDLEHPSSYYFIPTAVVSSASFLNNRYLQLQRILERKNIAYNPDLLWLYAAMAYNKGTRSVLLFWNDARRRGGNRLVEKLVNDKRSFFRSFRDARRLTQLLKKIWPAYDAGYYAKELKIHLENLRDCSITSEDQTRADPMENTGFN